MNYSNFNRTVQNVNRGEIQVMLSFWKCCIQMVISHFVCLHHDHFVGNENASAIRLSSDDWLIDK
jgi:hypothetical protein